MRRHAGTTASAREGWSVISSAIHTSSLTPHRSRSLNTRIADLYTSGTVICRTGQRRQNRSPVAVLEHQDGRLVHLDGQLAAGAAAGVVHIGLLARAHAPCGKVQTWHRSWCDLVKRALWKSAARSASLPELMHPADSTSMGWQHDATHSERGCAEGTKPAPMAHRCMLPHCTSEQRHNHRCKQRRRRRHRTSRFTYGCTPAASLTVDFGEHPSVEHLEEHHACARVQHLLNCRAASKGGREAAGRWSAVGNRSRSNTAQPAPAAAHPWLGLHHQAKLQPKSHSLSAAHSRKRPAAHLWLDPPGPCCECWPPVPPCCCAPP